MGIISSEQTDERDIHYDKNGSDPSCIACPRIMKWFRKGKRGRTVEPSDDSERDREPTPPATSKRHKATRNDVAQISMRGDPEVVDRFRQLCRADRRTYLEMLSILMDHYEGPKPR